MAASQGSVLDLVLVAIPGGYRLLAQSATGMLWLQTHFEAEHWHLLAAGHVSVEASSARLIDTDAREAGLAVSHLPGQPHGDAEAANPANPPELRPPAPL